MDLPPAVLKWVSRFAIRQRSEAHDIESNGWQRRPRLVTRTYSSSQGTTARMYRAYVDGFALVGVLGCSTIYTMKRRRRQEARQLVILVDEECQWALGLAQ